VAGWNPGDERLTVAAHQAAGMVAEQAHCDIRAAFDRLFATSAAKGWCVTDTALNVIDGTIHFVEDAPTST
jgi:hypothetical protein